MTQTLASQGRAVVASLLIFYTASPTLLQAVQLKVNAYHDQNFIAKYLKTVSQQHSDIATLKTLGRSRQGREIKLITLSSGDPNNKPAIYINGTHHGNEKASTEGVLSIIDYFTDQKNQTDTAKILDRYALYIQPLVNPDGHAMNSRYESTGIDPNRDYSHPERDDQSSFQAPETRLVSQLLKRRKFLAAAAFHSGIEAVFWPWCYSDARSYDHKIFQSIGELIANAMGFPTFSQSYHDYQSHGEFIDYAYMKYRTFAFTIEVSRELAPAPNKLRGVRSRSIQATLAMILGLEESLRSSRQQAH